MYRIDSKMNPYCDSANSGRIVPHYTPEHPTGHRLIVGPAAESIMAFEELKQRHPSCGATVPTRTSPKQFSGIHALVIKRLDPQSGLRWLDLAYGTGTVAELAARAVRGSLASTSLRL